MKRHTLSVCSALAVILGLAACSKSELSSPAGVAESTPMVFTASGLNPANPAATFTAATPAGAATSAPSAPATPAGAATPSAAATSAPSAPAAFAATRTAVDGDWQGVTSVAVKKGNDVKAYRVNASSDDGYASAMLVADGDPLYWEPGEASASVTAWWPCSDGQQEPPAVRVGEDQRDRERFEQSDLIVAGPQTVTPIRQELRFTHRTALVHIVLTDYTEGLESVRLTGLSTRDGNPAEIFPYDEGGYTYSALVAPQEVAAGTAFIACTFDSGKTFAYRMQNTVEWLEGKEYTYTVSLAAAEDPGYTYDDATHTYIVHSAKGLQAWNEAAQNDLSLNCTLTADITLPEVLDGESNWTPVGSSSNSYTGTFEGGDHTITGLTIYLPNQDYVGLFGRIGQYGTAVTVQHLTLAGVEITGNEEVGGVVGYNSGGTLTACYATGDVSGNEEVGGVVGYNSGGTVTACSATGDVSGNKEVGGVVGYNSVGTVTDCTFSGTVTGTGDDVGGVVGWNSSGTLTACSATGDVSGNKEVGGVVGYNWNGTLIDCYATGNVTGTGDDVGGVVGSNSGGTATACYHAAGDVSGNNSVGGVAGYNWNGTLTACYHAAGTVSGNGYVGGVAGYNKGTAIACYATGDVTGTGNYVGGVAGYNNGTATACYATGDVTGTGNYVGGVAGYNWNGTLTACYWSNNLDAGVGDSVGNSSAEVTKVDGKNVTWQMAVDAMNVAIEKWNAEQPLKSCNRKYELPDENSLPVLKEEQ